MGKPRGLFRNEGIVPMIGDHVVIVPSGDTDFPFQIVDIAPRRNDLIRPPVSNLDVLVITVSCKTPAPDEKLIDKLLILCGAKDIFPVLWITKRDLDEKRASRMEALYNEIGFTVRTSSKDSFDSDLRSASFLVGKTVIFAGQSGVGKSTLCNALLGEDYMEVGKISTKLQRGKHTTRHVELIPFGDGGFIADTPGFSSLRLPELGVQAEEVVFGYPELLRVKNKCRFQDCRHMGEDGCAVEESGIDPNRLARYREFVKELQNVKKYS